MKNFNKIKSRNDLALLLDIPLKTLTYILYIKGVDKYYNSFQIPKKNDKLREINAPSGALKDLQRELLFALSEFQKELVKTKKMQTNISHGFEEGKGIITNAKVHINKCYVLNLDLENFFQSFHFGRVRGYFEKNRNFKLPIEIATIITQLTCYKGCLPQGAPTSPIITNFICNILDMRLLKIARKYKLDYTRYADDLSFSTNDKYFVKNKDSFYYEVKSEIERFGLFVNDKKTRLAYKDSRQEVTGLVVNKKINTNKKYYKNTRAMANNLYTNGRFTIDGLEGTINQLEGRFAFINQMDHYNNKLDKGKHHFRNLNSREKQYQKFLVYKYFFANSKPLVVTEGKTDIIYIRAAIKKYHSNYPNLIEKRKDGKYDYKISFLRRTSRLKYFLGICEDGADTMKNIYNFYTGENNLPNIIEKLAQEGEFISKNPVVLIFDNEQKSGKPLKQFKNHIGLNQEIKLSYKIKDNLHLLTNPLVGKSKESELEDLFDKSVLLYKIKGKKFSRDNNFDISKYYGKHIFSKYISESSKEINFDSFIPMLDELDNIVKSY